MKIQTIFTGGTIGSGKRGDGRIALRQGMSFHLLDWYRQQYGGDVNFIVEEPYRILSENLDAVHLNKLIECVGRCLGRGGADGILIMHGTDTLQYSAAMLAYVFGAADIPVVLVSSNFPLGDERANGYTNFRYAVEFIRGAYGTGVFVSYCNPGGIPTVHRGSRLLAYPVYSSALESLGGGFGTFSGGRYVPFPDYRAVRGLPAMFGREKKDVRLDGDARKILHIVPHTGMVYPELGDGVKAVLHESYHSGTIAISAGLKDFAAKADARGVPIYLTGFPAGEAEYETVGMYRKLGIRPLPQAAPISQFCKLWLALSNGVDPEEVMYISIAEDIYPLLFTADFNG